ncbi:MAG: hypothetical protein IJ688_14620 [Treponema sp.]|nr:hypothetical protein [Treponema sp.]
MEIAVKLDIDEKTISQLSAESESNASMFVRIFCSELLQKISLETKEIYETVKKINIENPYGFPQ